MGILWIAFILVEVMFLFAVLPFIIRWLAKEDLANGKESYFFTFPTTNLFKFVEHGGSKNDDGKWEGGVFGYIIPETPGYILGDDGVSRKIKPGEKWKRNLTWYNRILFKRWSVVYYGFYPFSHVHTRMMSFNRDRIEGTGPKNWIDDTKGKGLVPGIRAVTPRPFIFTEVELGDGLSVDLKLVPIVRVIIPYKVAYEFTDDAYYTKAAATLQSLVIDRLKESRTLGDFKKATKGELGGMLHDFVRPLGTDKDGNEIPSELNAELLRQVGIVFEGLGINDWQASSEKVRAALEVGGIAESTGDANIIAATKAASVKKIDADGYATALGITTDAEVASQNKLTGARGNRIRETVVALVLPGTDPNVASRGAADVLEMEAATSGTSKITAIVKDGSKIVVPVGGSGK